MSGSAAAVGADTVSVGNNEVGEPCNFRPLASDEANIPAQRAVALYCGKWDQPSGRIFVLGGNNGSSPSTSAWRNYLAERFNCGPPTETSILSGNRAELMQCVRRYGGWPQIALTTTAGGRTFGADAVPSALPALEASIGALAGLRVGTAERPPSEAAQLIARRSPGRPFGSGDLGRYYDLMNAGDAYNNVDDPANAEQSYREGLAIQQRILGSDNPGLALTLMKLAAQISHQRTGPEADRLLASAATLTQRSNDPLVLAELDYYRAVAAAYQGKPRDAENWAQMAEQKFSRLLPPAVAERAPPDAGALGLRASGIDLAVLTTTERGAPAQTTAILGLAETLRLRAALAARAGDSGASTTLALKADRLLEATGLTVSSTGARSLRLLAANEAKASNYNAAGSYGSDAQQVFQRVTPGERPQAVTFLQQGDYLLQRGRVGEALALFRQAGAILRRPGVVAVEPQYIYPWLDALRQEAERDPRNQARLYAEMFEAAQLGMGSRTALDIAQATARLAASDPRAGAAIRDYQDKKRALEGLLAERDEAVAEHAADLRVGQIDAKIATAQKSRDAAEAAILSAAPRYSEFSEKPASAEVVRSRVGSDEAVIFFFVSPRGSYGFVVERSGIFAYAIPLTESNIAALVKTLRDSAVERSAGLPEFDLAAAYRLYAGLFGPAQNDLSGVARLAVCANGDLLRFPMAALVTQPGSSVSNGDYRHVPWLVRQFALSYFPSPRVLVNLRAQQTSASGSRPYIGFGDFRPATREQLAAAFPPNRCHDDFEALSHLRGLPDTRIEVERIGQQLGAGPGEIVLGDAFTKARLLQSDLSRYQIILLASHALLPDDLKCQGEPSIVISVPPRAPNADPGFLRTSDIEKLKLDAELVVLSACSTAGPDARTGESLSGLARAFFRGGAHGLLVTHWSIVSGAAIPLMISTVSGNAAAAAGTAQALRQAQLQMIDEAGSANKPIELSYPNYWAAFALIGDGVPTKAPGA